LLITIRKKEKVWGGKKNYGKGAGWRITKFEFVVKNGLQAKLIYHNDEVAKKKVRELVEKMRSCHGEQHSIFMLLL